MSDSPDPDDILSNQPKAELAEGRLIRTIMRRPFFVVMIGLSSVAMLGPALHGFWTGDNETGRIFFYWALLCGFIAGLLGLATHAHRENATRSYLISLACAFLVLPLMLALPMAEASTNMTYFDAWFEAVSSITTTGATLYESPRDLPASVHLWRAMMGWGGGLLIWVSAVAILAPLNIGGFEIRATRGNSASQRSFAQIGQTPTSADRLIKYGATLVPLYVALTLLLWIGLLFAGDVPFVALCHAMSIMATSGISPVGGILYAPSGMMGEVIIFVFFVLALSRVTFAKNLARHDTEPVWKDAELRLGLFLIGTLSILLMLRHALHAPDSMIENDVLLAARALWGAVFTLTSFLTTTGFESAYWSETQNWSGLGTPGLVLVGLSVIGGGVATTAGGIKLLRIYALYKHSEREVERMVHPSSVGGAGSAARQIRRQGAQIAWIFFMLFALSIALVTVLLSLTGVQFETALILSVAALSTTGPLAAMGAETPISYAGLSDIAQGVVAVAMVVGRLEALALIALFSPEFWRR